MRSRPSLVVAVRMARHRQTLSDQLVLGLLTGGLLGAGLLIHGRESDRIRFRKPGGWLRPVPDRGEIRLSSIDSGETVVECRVWCGGMALRRSLLGLLLGLIAAALGFVGLWIRSGIPPTCWLGPALGGSFLGLLGGVLGWLGDRARLRRQVEAFIHNTTYLKAM